MNARLLRVLEIKKVSLVTQKFPFELPSSDRLSAGKEDVREEVHTAKKKKKRFFHSLFSFERTRQDVTKEVPLDRWTGKHPDTGEPQEEGALSTQPEVFLYEINYPFSSSRNPNI